MPCPVGHGTPGIVASHHQCSTNWQKNRIFPGEDSNSLSNSRPRMIAKDEAGIGMLVANGVPVTWNRTPPQRQPPVYKAYSGEKTFWALDDGESSAPHPFYSPAETRSAARRARSARTVRWSPLLAPTRQGVILASVLDRASFACAASLMSVQLAAPPPSSQGRQSEAGIVITMVMPKMRSATSTGQHRRATLGSCSPVTKSRRSRLTRPRPCALRNTPGPCSL